MKRTAYNEHIRKIKCSEDFRAKMERALSSPPQEIHEYTDSVQGVERARKFNINRFGALAAALVIIGGGVGFGMYGMKNMRITNPMYGDEQFVSGFPYNELKDLHNSQQIHGEMNWDNHNDKMAEQLAQTFNSNTGDMSNIRLDTLFEFFDMDEWESVDHKDMSDTKGKSNLVITLHPDGYKRFTGVYYLFQIFDDGQAYFIKYDMSDDSVSDHIVSEYCYKFDENTFMRYRELLRISTSDELYSSVKNMNICYIYSGEKDSNNIERTRLISAISEITNKSMKVKLFDALKWSSYEEISCEDIENEINEQALILVYEDNTAGLQTNELLITDYGKLIFNIDENKCMMYDVGTDFYEEMENIAESNEETGNQTFELAEQEDIDRFIEENVSEKINLSLHSDIMTPPAEYRGDNFMLTSEEIPLDDLDAVKEKMKSMQWEKCDKIFPYTEENANIEKQISWMNGGDILFFNNNGMLYTPEECYRAENQDEANELLDMLYANIDKADSNFRMAAQLTEGCKFRNLSGQCVVSFNVPAEASIIDDGHWLTASCDCYIDNETGEMMYTGRAATAYEITDPALMDTELRKFIYRKYPDGKEYYEEKLGDGTITAHYEGYDNLFPIFDYEGLCKKILKDIYVFDENEEDVMPYVDEDNGEYGHIYTFLLSKIQTRDTELWVELDKQQGRLLDYRYHTFVRPFLLEDNDPEDITEEFLETVYVESWSTDGSYNNFDKDDFSIPQDNEEYDRPVQKLDIEMNESY